MKKSKKIIAVIFAILAFGFAGLNYYLAESTKRTADAVVFKQDISKGTKIEESMLSTKPVGTFGLGDIVLDKSDIIGKIALEDTKMQRPVYKDKFSDNYRQAGFEQRIQNSAVAINTSLVASVAAEIKENSIVQLALIEKSQNGATQLYYPAELSRVRVLKMTMDSGVEVNPVEESTDIVKDDQKRPAVLVLDLTEAQAKMVLPYSYGGSIHCIMLNEHDAQMYRDAAGI